MNRIFSIGTTALLLGACLAACNPVETDPVAKAVIPSASVMQFEAQGAAPQTITVYSDGEWVAESPEWISLSQRSGSGTVEGVTVSVSDNKDGQGLLAPRRDTITIHGNRLISYAYIIVIQAGDKYRGAAEATPSTLASVKDGQFVNFGGAQVMATDGSNAVLSDGKGLLLMPLKQQVAPGDVIGFKGVKETVSGQPVINDIEDFKVTSHSEPAYPAATDITATLDATTVGAPAFVTVSGVYDGSVVEVKDATKKVAPTALAELGLGGLAGHKVTVTGYAIGMSGDRINLIATAVTDNGLDQIIYFKDDFEWLEPWSSAANAGNDVANNKADTDAAPNILATAALSGLVEEFQKRGYGYVWGWKDQEWSDGLPDNGNKRTMYLQRNYLKFGKTSYNSGIILPAMSEIQGTADIQLEFDWCWSMTGADKPDIMQLTALVSGAGTFDATGSQDFGAIDSAQPTADDLTVLAWQHVTIRINGANSATRITLRPINNDPSISNSRKQNRWYLDNILVTPAEGSGDGPGGGDVKPGTVVWEDDFEWIAPWATAATAGDAVKDNDPGTTAPNVFTSEACAGFMDAFTEKGYTYLWGPKDGGWSDSLGDDNPKVLYLQSNYLKFGKTSYNAAIKLPALAKLAGATANVELTFDWCWQVTGAFKPDLMTLAIQVENGGSYDGPELQSAQSQVDGESKIEWQHASVVINGVTGDSRITISPANADPLVSNSARKQNRWYLDNVKVTVK